MTTFNMTCEAVEVTLPDYLDETLEPWVRISIEEHLGGCVRCAGLARELRNLTREASTMPALIPEREIWSRVAGRIGAPVKVSEPVAESEPLPPKTEPVLSSDAFLPIGEPPVLASEPPLLADGPPLLAGELPLFADGPPLLAGELQLFADGPSLLADELPLFADGPPLLADELPLFADGPPLLPDALSLPTSEPPPLADVLSRPTTEPLAPPIEPLSSGPVPVPVPVTTPAYALPYRREKRWGSREMGLAAAALVLVTAGTTAFLTVQWLGRARTASVASGTGEGRGSSSKKPAESGTRTPSPTREQLASDASTPTPLPGQPGSALTVSATSAPQVARSPEEVVYDKEIKTLQGIVRRQKPELDASTVTVIDKNLRTLDSAIAQIRAALQKDPASPLLDAQATRALEMKVELLRRAAMLRSNTI